MSNDPFAPYRPPPGTTHLKGKLTCPGCKENIDGASTTDGADVAPSVDDITLCVYCEAVLTYQHNFHGWYLKALTETEILDLDDEVQAEIEKTRPKLAQVWGPLGSRKPTSSH